jgi:hypothetical protein
MVAPVATMEEEAVALPDMAVVQDMVVQLQE